MQNRSLFFSIVGISVAAIGFIAHIQSPLAGPRQGPGHVMGQEGGSQSRYEYELQRLADPETGKIPYQARLKELAFSATLPSDAMLASYRSTAPQSVWNVRGPWNVGGRTRAFGIDVANENILVAGSCSGGMWRSTDAGTTWTMTSSINAQHQSVSCLVQDKRPGETSTWYAGTGEAYGASASATGAYYLGTGIMKSTDNGQTWNFLSSTIGANPNNFDSNWDIVWNVATDNSDTTQDEVYAALYGGIYRSVNGGTNWTPVHFSANTYFTDVKVTPTGVVYATMSDDGGVKKGIWRSADGVTWTNITPTGFASAYNRIVIGICPTDESQVWFLGNTPGFGQPDTNFVGDVEWNSLWKYKYISGDGSGSGGMWWDKSAALPTTGGMFDKFNCQGSYDLMVEVHPSDTNKVFIGGTNLYRSDNGFADLSQTRFIGGYEQGASLPIVNMYANHHPDQHGIVFLPSNDSVMYSYNDGGIFRTDNCLDDTITYTSLNNGYLTTMFYTVAIDHAAPGNNIIVAGAQDNGSWFTNNTNLTSPWVTPRGGDGSYCAIADNQSMYYLSIQNGKMMKADLDNNGNVLSYARIDPIGGKGYQFINPYVLDPNNNNIMYLAGGKRIWRNDNLAGIPLINNWDSISTNWTMYTDTVPQTLVRISAVAISKTPANRLYYGTTNRRVFRVDNAHIGTPTPVDITSTLSTAQFPGGNVSCVAVNPNNADEVIVTFSNYNAQSAFYSTTGGLPTTSWSRVGGNLETGFGPSVRWAAIIPVSDGTVYMLATSTGIYATDTLMGTSTVWVKQAANTIGNSVCDMIDYRTSDGLVVVATHAHGIYSTTITSVNDIVTVKDLQAVVPDFQLVNYPNPFSDQTTIAFTVPDRARVKLSVLDELGQLVKVLVDESLQGEQSLVFNSGLLASGVYYVNLQVGELSQTRKMMIVK
ncbi:MAG: T9SS type A sorting domain-containing protein [Bacteroidota bacterium]